MAFYACGHYSRAFVLISATETVTPVAGIVPSFLRKDFADLIPRIDNVLLQNKSPMEKMARRLGGSCRGSHRASDCPRP